MGKRSLRYHPRLFMLAVGILILTSLACQMPAAVGQMLPDGWAAIIAPPDTPTPFLPQSLPGEPTFEPLSSWTPSTSPTLTNTPTITFTASPMGTLGTGTPTNTLTGTLETLTATPSMTGTQTLTSVILTSTKTKTLAPSATLTNTIYPGTSTRTGTRTSTPIQGTFTVTRTRTNTSIPGTATTTRTYTNTSIPGTNTQTRTPTIVPATLTPSPTTDSTAVHPGGPVSASQLISAMNAQRVANGYSALPVNSILMYTAQWTAEYMAANHLLNHIGNVNGRIAAAGYGNGSTVFATENWAMGFTTLSQIMNAWSDALHQIPATNPNLTDIGAGVATGPWGTYYIIHAAYHVGPTSVPTLTNTSTHTSTPIPTFTSTVIPSTLTFTVLPPTSTETTLPPTATVCSISGNGGFEATLLSLINQERTNQGLPVLTNNGSLQTAASIHSQDMACKDFFSHTGSDGSSPFDRISAQGYSYSAAGENIYAGNGSYNSPDQAFSSWMASPGHHDIMMSPDFTEVGIGYSFNPSSTYGGYFTADFAKP